MIYRLCLSCSVVAANADTSHLDAEDELRVTAFLEAAGLLALVGEQDEAGYWDCDCCGWTQIGDPAQRWETM
ncbi:hypothetical protein GII33_13905 [Gordonia pseudamarae]|jgi:hypothetical protein|uniref:Uncharacterized protein n=1 Tax=Gordonia pseudamarae TaxID=2831662 RepID=A0ABX6IKX8_9ACTN|nr:MULTISPECIES: hypothetical protein [Gordonia]MBD0022548.1 hypothetical protein [Gordonia sp. (in: high G+C Gram-positive bacteria)]QHN26881.1 hypothetical protein GII33_13905 [Gordonia pseudamarae]QHN35771.1 hypothetical protein GII31_13730 [Gordonia pseudamarae]